MFQHYANQFVPLVVPYAIMTVLTSNSSTTPSTDMESVQGFVSEQVQQDYTSLRELLFDDFIYEKGTEAEVS